MREHIESMRKKKKIEKKVRKGLKTKKEKRIKMIKSKGIEILKYVKKNKNVLVHLWKRKRKIFL